MPDIEPDIRLFVADMDSTIVAAETLDEIAAKAGFGAKVAEITQRAMRGEMDFDTSLKARVALLKGQPVSLLEDVARDMELNPGALALLEALKSKGIYTILISGGFTYFTERIADLCGFDAHFGNVLGVENGVLTGDVEGSILNGATKANITRNAQDRLSVSKAQTVAIGDGANDAAMFGEADIAVGYYPKDVLRAHSSHVIENGQDLSALIDILGIG